MTENAAIATVDHSPRALVAQYKADFAAVLPSHVKAESWVRIAQGALKTGRKTGHRFDLEIAAENNPAAFLQALRQAAALGLTPGSEEYYLTPRKQSGRSEILGIVGYQGYIELMYRAGAVSSVVAEVVYSNDKFSFAPGRDDIPQHEIDWDSEDRGKLRLVYAFARMKDGATSKVIVLNKADIAQSKAKSQGATSDYSPWVTNESAMWLKSAVRKLRKWVPTSAEYITTQVRAVREGQKDTPSPIAEPFVQEHIEDDVIEAELVTE